MWGQSNTTNPLKCVVCEEAPDSKPIRCKKCKNVAHPSCALRGEPGKRVTDKEIKDAAWYCDNCKTTEPGMKPSSPSVGVTPLDLEAFRASLAALFNGRFDQLDGRFAGLESSFEFLSKQYDTLTEEVKSLRKEQKEVKKALETANKMIAEKDDTINQLSARVNHLEQAGLALNLEFHGVPTSAGENLLTKVQEIATQIGAPQVADTIEDVYRVSAPLAGAQGNRPRPGRLVVRFKHKSARNAWLDSWKAHMRRQREARGRQQEEGTSDVTAPGQVAPSFASATGGRLLDPSLRVFEQLTFYNKRLLFMTREAARAKNFKFVWVKDGKIFARHSEQLGQVLRIACEGDIRRHMGHNVPTFRV
jgi:uncharacterized protein YoxC